MQEGPDVNVADRTHALVVLEYSLPVTTDEKHSDRGKDDGIKRMDRR